MSARTTGTAIAVVVGGGVLIAPVVLMAMVMTGARTEVGSGGCGEVVSASGDLPSGDELSRDQLANAAEIVRAGSQMGVPRKGLVIALAAAHQESRFLNYANDGRGSDLRPDQDGIERSQQLDHQAVGTDHGSLGVFQQQWPWWGSMHELMDPATAAIKFFQRLVRVPGWEAMSVTDAAQAVQRSAFPDAYADDEALAEDLLSDEGISSGSARQTSWTGEAESTGCAPDVIDGVVAHPLARTVPFTDQENYGSNGGRWARGHTGTDFSTACGTPVRAAHAGVVHIDTDQSWSGPWLVKVSTGGGRLATWYAHMQAIDVDDGEHVRVGQQMGEVGSRGNSSGCHLHFEVHPRGGSIYEDGVNPTEWLQTHAGADLSIRTGSAAGTGSSLAASASGSFVLASFNVLGHSHTSAGGHHAHWASGPARMRGAIRLLDRYDVEVAGLQELQRPQKKALQQIAGDRYAVYSPPGDTENSIAWRRDRWAFVSADTVPIPYFNGRIRDMPIVRLRNLATQSDAIFVNVHNPANTRKFRAQGRFRAEALRRELAIMRGLASQYDVPAFLTGDFNDRSRAFCALTGGGTLTSPAGGSHVGRCSPPRRSGIDWIFGTRPGWSGYSAVKTPKQTATSDHPLVMARVDHGSS